MWKTSLISGGDREYFTLHEDTTGAEETTSEEAATEDAVTPEATADIPDETTAKAVTETVAEAEDVLAEATGAVANAADAETSEVIGDEYMGLSDVSEDPSVLSDQDKLDV